MRGLLPLGMLLLLSACSDPEVQIEDETAPPSAVPTQSSDLDVTVDPAPEDDPAVEPLRPPYPLEDTVP